MIYELLFFNINESGFFGVLNRINDELNQSCINNILSYFFYDEFIYKI